MSFNYLYIYTTNNELKEQYIQHIKNHNDKMISSSYPDAGFDLLTPNEYLLNNDSDTFLLDTEVVCYMVSYTNKNLSYYLYPRSSIIKYPLRLANSVGIIDSGYRGNIKACFDIKSNKLIEPIVLNKYSRLVQICSPTLKPLIVTLIDNVENMDITERNDGGFGSSGI